MTTTESINTGWTPSPINYLTLADALMAEWSYMLDAGRVRRAVDICQHDQAGNPVILRAKMDEAGNPIQPSADVWIVRSSARPPYKNNDKVWYIVRPRLHLCQCQDHANGNVCKHRIAVGLYIRAHNLVNCFPGRIPTPPKPATDKPSQDLSLIHI